MIRRVSLWPSAPRAPREGRVQWVVLLVILLVAGLPILGFLMSGSSLETILGYAESDVTWDEYVASRLETGGVLQGPAAAFLQEFAIEFDRRGKELRGDYRPASQLVYRDRVISACHGLQAVSGPFYCSDEERVYLEQAFFDDLEQPFGPKSQLAQYYLVSFLLAQHLQARLGLYDRLTELETSRTASEILSFRRSLHLQASYWSGVVASRSPKLKALLAEAPMIEVLRHVDSLSKSRIERFTIEGGELGESLDAASPEQRAVWFELGLKSGRYEAHPELPDLEL